MAKNTNYQVVWPVEHDGQRYDQGASISLNDAQAAPLLAVGAIAGTGGNARSTPEQA